MYMNGHRTNTDSTHRNDSGFTLVELLIVIVILGILATVTVFAVRGITDRGQENAEGADLKTLATAVDAYWLDNRTNPTEAELVSGGYLTEESSFHELTVAGDGTYEITNVRTGVVVGSGAAGSGSAGGPPVSAASATAGTPTTVGGFPALAYGPLPATRPFYVVGGSVAGAQWDAVVATSPTLSTSNTVIFIDIAQITDTATAQGLQPQIDASWGRVFSQADDIADFDGSGLPLSTVMESSTVPGPSVRINDGGSNDVAWAFAQN